MTNPIEVNPGLIKVTYHHPVVDSNGKRLSTANIIWAERNLGSAYYRVSKFAMNGGKFPATHPCSPFDDDTPANSAQMGGSKQLTEFRSRGYWASCFPEGDGITLKWWEDVAEPSDKSAGQVMADIRECFGWKVVLGR
jgi:hypothetical protein